MLGSVRDDAGPVDSDGNLLELEAGFHRDLLASRTPRTTQQSTSRLCNGCHTGRLYKTTVTSK